MGEQGLALGWCNHGAWAGMGMLRGRDVIDAPRCLGAAPCHGPGHQLCGDTGCSLLGTCRPCVTCPGHGPGAPGSGSSWAAVSLPGVCFLPSQFPRWGDEPLLGWVEFAWQQHLVRAPETEHRPSLAAPVSPEGTGRWLRGAGGGGGLGLGPTAATGSSPGIAAVPGLV